MTFKETVRQACLQQLEEKIKSLRESLHDLAEGAQNDAKSSAGDKHETGRAMVQLEQEKISGQLGDALMQKDRLEQMALQSPVVAPGSLVKTNRGYLYISIAMGKITVAGIEVITLSIQSPLGQKLSGLKNHEQAEINGVKYVIGELL